MTPTRILQLNAAFTALGAVVMLLTRGTLPGLFGLSGPAVLDALAVALLGYAGVVVLAARQQPVRRDTLMAFTLADAAWVIASAVVLVLFWQELTAAARLLLIGVAVVVELFAAVQFRAARHTLIPGAAQ